MKVQIFKLKHLLAGWVWHPAMAALDQYEG